MYIRIIFLVFLFQAPLSWGQSMLQPDNWEDIKLVPDFNPEFIVNKGIAQIEGVVRTKRPNEGLVQKETLVFTFGLEGDLVSKWIISRDTVKEHFVYEDGLLKIKTRISDGIEIRENYVYDHRGGHIETQFLKRRVGEAVPSMPFKTEKITASMRENGRVREKHYTDQFGTQLRTERIYLDDYGQRKEIVRRKSGRNQNVKWTRNREGRVIQISSQSNFSKQTLDFSYNNGRLSTIKQTLNSNTFQINYQYEGEISGALSSILRTNLATTEMEIVQFTYISF